MRIRSPAKLDFFSVTFGVSKKSFPPDLPLLPNPSLPGPYYYWPGNPVIKPAALAAILNGGEAATICAATPRLDSRLPARMTNYK
ncbi:hypothetical protein [Candidatus Spongiihabitans sp.]|uniref:hypothetical protein n=1 Tax=Candidatus Spongiihabitans sp. TaxID=3101308 RepID=UPI003C7DEC15